MTKKGLRVCMTTQEYPPMFWGGLAQAVRRVALFVADMGWEVHVANLYEDQAPPGLLDEIIESRNEDGLMVHRVRIGREGDLPRKTLWDSPNDLSIRLMHLSLERLHRMHEFDVFHVFFLYPIGYVAALVADAYQKDLIVSIRGNDINQYIFGPEKATFIRTTLRRANLVTSVAQDLLVKAETLTPVMDKSRIIFNSIPSPDGPSPAADVPGLEGPVIGTVGLFKGSKGLPYLLRAFQEIRQGRRTSLLVVGDIREVERKIQNRYFSQFGSEDVHVTGPVPHESIGSYMRRMDVFVLPSLSEGCPNVLLEAMASARPIVATRVGAVPDVIRDGESGILVDPGDSLQLSKAILYMLDHPEKAVAMGQHARQRVSDFSPDRERQAWRSLYDGVRDGLNGVDMI